LNKKSAGSATSFFKQGYTLAVARLKQYLPKLVEEKLKPRGQRQTRWDYRRLLSAAILLLTAALTGSVLAKNSRGPPKNLLAELFVGGFTRA